MRTIGYVGALGVALGAALGAGCGGGGSASPFGGTTLDSRGDLGARATGANAVGKAGRLVPVFLSTSQEPTSEDQWLQLAGLQVSGASDKYQVLPEGERIWVRLNGLRGAEGRRYLFVGMAPAGPRLVRAQVSLGSAARLFVTGQEKPVDVPIAQAGQKSETLSVNLDSASELKDALVLDLALANAEKGAWSPKLALGSADGVQDPRRHEASWLAAKVGEVADKQDAPWTLLLGDARAKSMASRHISLPGGKPDAKPAKGAVVRVLGRFDPEGSILNANEVFVGDWSKSGFDFIVGQALAMDAKAGTVRVGPSLAWGAAPPDSSVSVVLPASILGEDGKPMSLEQAEAIVPGRPIWVAGTSPKADQPFSAKLAGVCPTPKLDPNRERAPIPPLPVKKPAEPR